MSLENISKKSGPRWPISLGRLIPALLVSLMLASPVLAEREPVEDTMAVRRARAEAWIAEQENRLKAGPGDEGLPPVAITADVPPLELELGGEDVLIEVTTSFPEPKLEITSTGIIYVAVARSLVTSGSFQVINIYRSDDGGRSFDLWSVFEEPSPDGISYVADFEIAEGDSDRAFLAYITDSSPDRTINVAWADLTPTSPVWNHVPALSMPGWDFTVEIDLETDSIDFPGYFLYLAASANVSGGRDIWFTRSTDLGLSWEAGYRVAQNSAGLSGWFSNPKLGYGADSTIHLMCELESSDTEQDDTIVHRIASSFADGGLPSWGGLELLDEQTGGNDVNLLAMGASPANGTVLAHIADFPGGEFGGARMMWSDGSGRNWARDNEVSTDIFAILNGDIDIDPMTGSAWLLGINQTSVSGNIEIASQSLFLSAPGVVSDSARWSGQDMEAFNSFYDLEHDPSRGHQRAVVWQAVRDGVYEVYFDAEWHRAPGWPNTEAGFPLTVDGIGRTPPAIADVDDDPFEEIIFATEGGLVYVVNHDGTIAPGWPVYVGTTIPWDAPVAVGDLNGDDQLEIVVGNDIGQVFAYNPDGSLMSGWPVNLGTDAPTFVSIGALGPPYPRYVVALSGNRIVVLKQDGEDISPFWGTSVEELLVPAAIGDVDGDGVGELVVRQLSSLAFFRLDTNGPVDFRLFPGETLSGMISLVDIDEDGDLEITVGTVDGVVHLMNHDMSDYSPAFPYDTGNPSPVVGVVPVNLLGTYAPELVFTQLDGTTHIVYEDGDPGLFYPNNVPPPNFVYMPPIVTNVFGPSPDVVVSAGNSLYCWENLGAVPEGWPHLLGDFIEESTAAGDIDLDGNIEIVALGLNRLTVLDVGNPPNLLVPQGTWPMFGYNAQRTGCLDCTENLVSAVDDPLAVSPSRLAFAPPFPNPASNRTALSYSLPAAAQVKLQIFDVRGRLVRTLAEGQQEPGNYEVFWNGKAASGRRVALGMYLAKLDVRGPDGSEQRVRKISLVR